MEITNKHIATNKTSEESEEVRKRVWKILETVSDPEVPVLSVIDLGVVREVVVTLPPPLQGAGGLMAGEVMAVRVTVVGFCYPLPPPTPAALLWM